MASQQAREFYASSGLPKRAGIETVSKTEFSARDKRMRSRSLKRRGFDDQKIDRYFEVMANPVVLSEKDIIDRADAGSMSQTLNEVILANWQIEAWYVDQVYQARSFFNKHVPEGNITKPVYLIIKSNQAMNRGVKRKFDLSNERHAKLFLKYLNRD
jgi:hypothetical protein